MGELDGDERLSLAGAQAFLEEEENEVSAGLAKKSHEVSEQLDISTFALLLSPTGSYGWCC